MAYRLIATVVFESDDGYPPVSPEEAAQIVTDAFLARYPGFWKFEIGLPGICCAICLLR